MSKLSKISMSGLKNKKLIISVFLLVVLIAATYIYFTSFFIREQCITEYCFLDNLKDCKKVTYSYLQDSATWSYTIKGTQGDSCRVSVTVLSVGTETSAAKALEGKDMICYIPIGVAVLPEEKIEYCHGLLKEAIQDQIIERMHLYIVQKIGQIEQKLGMSNSSESIEVI